jgi:hypothetical protein
MLLCLLYITEKSDNHGLLSCGADEIGPTLLVLRQDIQQNIQVFISACQMPFGSEHSTPFTILLPGYSVAVTGSFHLLFKSLTKNASLISPPIEVTRSA